MKLKVCGITNEADALAAAQAGVDYLGYVINYTVSPRFIDPLQASKIIHRVQQLYPAVQHVAVLVSPTDLFLTELSGLSFDIFQVYGTVSKSPMPIWKSIIVHTPEDLKQFEQLDTTVAAVHCDAGLGSGKAIQKDLLKNIQVTVPLIIAGGITQQNVAEIIEQCHPTVVDVNSGVESVPGKKDSKKIYALRQLVF